MPIVLITFATFAVVTTIVVSLYYSVTAESPVTQRVRRLVGEPSRPAPRAGAARGDRPGFIGPVLARIGKYGIGSDRALAERLSVAGIRAANAASHFLGARTVVSLAPALLFLVSRVSSGSPVE